jgi:hypothetical protein
MRILEVGLVQFSITKVIAYLVMEGIIAGARPGDPGYRAWFPRLMSSATCEKGFAVFFAQKMSFASRSYTFFCGDATVTQFSLISRGNRRQGPDMSNHVKVVGHDQCYGQGWGELCVS